MLSAPITVFVMYLVWLAIFTTGAQHLSLIKRLIAIGIVGIGLQVPILDTTAFFYLRGVFGDFSATHVVWALVTLINSIAARQIIVIPQRQKITVALILLVCAALFYPSALGAIGFDIYRMGFEPFMMLMVLGALALLAWYRGENFLLVAITAGVLAFTLSLLESNNLWDYLLDPLLVIYSAVWLFFTLVRFVFHRVTTRPIRVAPYDEQPSVTVPAQAPAQS